MKEIARAIRGHWVVESYHWHLDVTFRKDVDRTIEKQAAFNLSIIIKYFLNAMPLGEHPVHAFVVPQPEFRIDNTERDVYTLW